MRQSAQFTGDQYARRSTNFNAPPGGLGGQGRFSFSSVGHSEPNTPPASVRSRKSAKRSSFDYSVASKTITSSHISNQASYSNDMNDNDSVQDDASISSRDNYSMSQKHSLASAMFDHINHNNGEDYSSVANNNEKMNRALGQTQSVGTSVNVLCRMRPLTSQYSFPAAAQNNNVQYGQNGVMPSSRNSMISLNSRMDRDEREDEEETDDDDDDNGTWKRRGKIQCTVLN